MTDTAATYIHGGSDPREVARLEKQAAWASPFILRHFDAAPGQVVLDLATGVGAMAGELAKRYPGIQLYGVDLRMPQLRNARARHPVARYVQADGGRLPFPDRTFDRVHASWLLEHVPDPVAILREVRRVLKPDGYSQFIEVDNSSLRTWPVYPEVEEAIALLNRAQRDGGGDPYVGQRLRGLYQAAGFTQLELRLSPVHGRGEEPGFYQGLIDEFAEIFESVDEAVGPRMTPLFHAAAARLRGLIHIPGSEMYYCGVVARAAP